MDGGDPISPKNFPNMWIIMQRIHSRPFHLSDPKKMVLNITKIFFCRNNSRNTHQFTKIAFFIQFFQIICKLYFLFAEFYKVLQIPKGEKTQRKKIIIQTAPAIHQLLITRVSSSLSCVFISSYMRWAQANSHHQWVWLVDQLLLQASVHDSATICSILLFLFKKGNEYVRSSIIVTAWPDWQQCRSRNLPKSCI